MSSTTPASDPNEVLQQLEKISRKPGTPENALFFEGFRMGGRPAWWAKVMKIAGGVVMVIVFVAAELFLPEDYGVILALFLSVGAAVATMLAVRTLAEARMTAQSAEWVQRAEKVIREHDQTAS